MRRHTQGRWRLWGGQSGISTLTVIGVIMAFLILFGVMLYGGLSIGILFSQKSQETIVAGLTPSQVSMEVLGTVTARATLVKLGGEEVETLGPADGKTTRFSLAHRPVQPDSETILLDGTIVSRDGGYITNYETGTVAFNSPPTPGALLGVVYSYYTIEDLTLTLGHAAEGTSINVGPGAMVVTYLDKDTLESDIKDFSLTRLGNADGDDLLEYGEIINLTIDISGYGLLAGQNFAIQLKPQVGSVINVAREVPIAVTPRMALR